MAAIRPNSENARRRLRRDTALSHQDVEAAFDLFDLNDRSGMFHTLTAHQRALRRLWPSMASQPELSDEIQRLLGLATQSLTALGVDGAAEMSAGGDGMDCTDPDLHPLAAAYVILGSRLGAEVLRRRLDALPRNWDVDVLAYFSDRGSAAHWKALQQLLGDVECDRETTRIVEGAEAAFGVFREEAMAAANRAGVPQAL